MLSIQNFQKNYDTGFKMAIEQLTFSEGIHLIKGKNGSGKSTLLKAIAGIHDFKGDIILNGISQKKEPIAYRKLVNFTEAEPIFPAFLSLDELINFSAKIMHSDTQQINKLKTTLDIGDYAKNPISSYSSGMLKKSALLLAFLGKPKLIILDEPFTTIDQTTQGELKRLILSKLENGISFLLTSHLSDFEDLFTYSTIKEFENGIMI
ncbi:ATP-binding cassette domain-containing protein [Algoriphagus sp.]|uniref:ABC transporter ATP-binding protein n=1 Tax=Algoriphagus sp. TaxID=1872435 RepID=UPI0025EB6974|nr:ATP-binding cassette domain-containing protein [Algoriphagus sp.]